MKGLIFFLVSRALTWILGLLLPWMRSEVKITPNVAQRTFMGGSIKGGLPGCDLKISVDVPVSHVTAQQILDDLENRVFWIGGVLLVTLSLAIWGFLDLILLMLKMLFGPLF